MLRLNQRAVMVWQTVEEASGEDELPFHDAIYLTIVTISTVGYGDFSPNSLLAKVTICGMLAIVFVVVPLQVRGLRIEIASPHKGCFTQQSIRRGFVVRRPLSKLPS